MEAHLDEQGPEQPGRDKGEEDRRLAFRRAGPGPAGKQDYGTGQFFTDALANRFFGKARMSCETELW